MLTEFLQISFLAVVQGFTEFLPISSSGHLILPAALFGWQDQGLVFDVAVHFGSLVAVVYYFKKQLIELSRAWCISILRQETTEQSKLAWLIVLATIPAGLSGLLLNDSIEEYARSIPIIATSSILFAILLYLSDNRKNTTATMASLTWKSVLFIGLAQIFALIPGTSRSGVTMTAGLFMNLSRHAASQFSFLLAIPLIAASGLLKFLDFYLQGASAMQWGILLYAAIISGIVSYLCIHYFLQLIQRVGFLPFVIYRLLLGLVLFTVYFW